MEVDARQGDCSLEYIQAAIQSVDTAIRRVPSAEFPPDKQNELAATLRRIIANAPYYPIPPVLFQENPRYTESREYPELSGAYGAHIKRYAELTNTRVGLFNTGQAQTSTDAGPDAGQMACTAISVKLANVFADAIASVPENTATYAVYENLLSGKRESSSDLGYATLIQRIRDVVTHTVCEKGAGTGGYAPRDVGDEASEIATREGLVVDEFIVNGVFKNYLYVYSWLDTLVPGSYVMTRYSGNASYETIPTGSASLLVHWSTGNNNVRWFLIYDPHDMQGDGVARSVLFRVVAGTPALGVVADYILRVWAREATDFPPEYADMNDVSTHIQTTRIGTKTLLPGETRP